MACIHALLWFVLSYLVCQVGDERMKQFKVERYTTDQLCQFCFSVIELNDSRLSTDKDGVRFVKRLGRVIKSGRGDIRIDYARNNTNSDNWEQAVHMLTTSQGKKFEGYRDRSGLRVSEIEGKASFNEAYSRIDPFRSAFQSTSTIPSFEKSDLMERFMSTQTEIPSDAGDKFVYFRAKDSVAVLAYEFAEGEDPWRIVRSKLFLHEPSLSKGRTKIKIDGLTSAQVKKSWRVAETASVDWVSTPMGWVPCCITSTEQLGIKTMYKVDGQIDLEMRFFDFEFEKPKVRTDLLEPSKFTVEEIGESFSVSRLEDSLARSLNRGRATKKD